MFKKFRVRLLNLSYCKILQIKITLILIFLYISLKAEQDFQHKYVSLQCHMILQKTL